MLLKLSQPKIQEKRRFCLTIITRTVTYDDALLEKRVLIFRVIQTLNNLGEAISEL